MQLLVLDATTKKIQLVLGEAATTELDYTASWFDDTATTVTQGNSNGTSNDTTPVDIVEAPGASTQRAVKDISVYNNDNISHTLTINYNDNGTTRKIWSGTLASGSVFYLSRVLSAGGGSPLTTKGDLYTYSTVNTRLEVGTNGYALVADSAEATGLKWIDLAARTESLSNKTILARTAAYTPAGAGTTTINLSTGGIHTVTMPANTQTLAISNGTVGQCFIVEINNVTSQGALTWFTTIRWAGGSAPSLTGTNGKRDTFGFRITGAGTYDGFVIGQNI